MGQVEGSRRDVRPKVSDAARPGDWDDGHSMYLLSMMHPGQCDLPRCGLVRSGDFLQRSGPRGCGSHTMKQSVTGRRVGNHHYAEGGRRGKQLPFDAALRQRPLLLQCSDRVDSVGAVKVLGGHVRQANRTDFALFDQFGHGSHGFLDRCALASMVQVIQVDHVDTEPSQACLTRLRDRGQAGQPIYRSASLHRIPDARNHPGPKLGVIHSSLQAS